MKIIDLGNSLGNSKIINSVFKPAGANMESRLRHWLYPPLVTLQDADIQSGQTVLEVGCGPGFFTIPAATLVGDKGHIIAMDVSSSFIKRVSNKVEAANLHNVQVLKRNALDTGLDTASIDTVIIFGVLPFPLLPLNQLLPEMHRVLKPDGTLSVWLWSIPFFVPWSIPRSGLFSFINKQRRVYNYRSFDGELENYYPSI
ncbi:class I SAM-dependent methyltransferase [candidate division KSB1 bacterium]|nr:class I SAM-dependent methyltransferase [candidate division KSB1 bacterium]